MNNLTPSDVAKMMIDGDLPTLCFINGELRRDLCRALQEGVSLEEGAFVVGFQDRLGTVLKITSAKNFSLQRSLKRSSFNTTKRKFIIALIESGHYTKKAACTSVQTALSFSILLS
jgi:hypothetical protein